MKISTFVFFDIETTGLPFQERNQTKIIELSFVAALREDIENTLIGARPNISKLTYLLNPKKSINPYVVKLTGLSREVLKNAPSFEDKFVDITNFLENLPKPVCLIAHNGNRFDYKILLAECIDASVSLPSHILCLDSLQVFKKILKNSDICYEKLTQESVSDLNDIINSNPVCSITLTTKNNSLNNGLLTDDEDDWPPLELSSEDLLNIDELCSSFSDISCKSSKIESREHKSKREVKLKKQKVVEELKKDTSKKKESYNLSALYERLLNKKENNAHRAEVDCMILLECVVALKKKILPLADETCILVNSIQPLCRYPKI